MHLSRSFGWIIQWDQPVIFNAMAFGPMLRRDMGREWADVPQAKVKGCRSFHGWVAFGSRQARVVAVVVIIGQILGDVVVFGI